MRTAVFGIAALALSTPLAAQSPEQVAAAALEAAPVWDGHNDVPGQLRDRYGNVIADFDFNDGTDVPPSDWGSPSLHTDLPRLREGKLGAQFWSVYVSASLPEPEATVAVMEQIDVMKRLIARYPDQLALSLTADDVEQAMAQGRIASLLGMEGGGALHGSLAVLRQFYDLGARYITLTHSKTLAWADSATDKPEHDGLTEFGEKVVREMQRLGMLVDLSHVSEATMMDALDVSGAPVIFSHSGARAVNGHPRNVPDCVLKRLPENGGIVMVVGLPGYLSEDLRQFQAQRSAEQARLSALWQGQPDAVEAAMDAWDEAHPAPQATVSDMADHIDHIREVAGVDHIGIGGDYDGMATGPVGMEDVSGYPALFVELARRGYSQEDLEKIASRNMMRVLRGAEAYAASRKDDLPIETPIAE
ncbi:membrane dipeptidase [Altererythrobacter atlanticus]|uniref:Membrane dipeptidase (Peptidase family M19) n=1 Tax=Croceibacterium atlanticum TaxID=1267766 RepID=A0A0F7KZ17_9SPHN|nr:dipeptidase [Croceibacterium atlanticum]AKH44070.1 Membrane dipeptidase (Peptidase family M19) [Croceibacterium atlanticum]MBB5732379.1 membrane dipeptidase [Croceibacterium atlanticum]